jgi:hypothetical protein
MMDGPSSRTSREAVSPSNSYRDTMGASAEFVGKWELVQLDELVKKLWTMGPKKTKLGCLFI